MKLADYMDTQHSRNPFWIWAHIHDSGPQWYLARLCRVFGEDDLHIQFVYGDHEDGHFEDYAENYEEREVVELVPPPAPEQTGGAA